MNDWSDDAVADRRHTIPDQLYIAEYPDVIGQAFIDLAASIDAESTDKARFNRRVADSVQLIRDAQAFTAAQRDGILTPTSLEISRNQQQIVEARKEIFDAIQDLAVASRYPRQHKGSE